MNPTPPILPQRKGISMERGRGLDLTQGTPKEGIGQPEAAITAAGASTTLYLRWTSPTLWTHPH